MSRAIQFGDVRVPYVALWTEEQGRTFVAQDSRCKNWPALFTEGRRGYGEPVLGKLHYARQRECVVRRRCQVCFEELGEGPWLAMDGGGQKMLGSGVAFVPLVTEPMCCRACAVYALEHCPGLASLRKKLLLNIYLVKRYEKVMQIVQPAEGSQYPELDACLKAYGRPVLGYMKYALAEYWRVSEEQVRKEAK